MKLRVVAKYINGDKHYTPGMEIEVTDEEGEFLQRDSPGSFETGRAKKEKPESPIESTDRMQRGGNRR